MSELKVYRDPKEGPCYREFYEKSEADKAIADLEESHKKEVEQLLIEIVVLKNNLSEIQSQKMQLEDDVALLRRNNAELKEERRWRSVSEELPKLEEDVGEIFLVAVEVESNASPRGSYVTSAEFCEGEWYNDTTGSEIEENIERDEEGLFYRSKVTHWRLLPKAPELAEKFKEGVQCRG